MGLINSILGNQNPISQFVDDNRNTLKGAFAGFGTGTSFGTGLSRAVKGATQGGIMDDEARVKAEAAAKEADQLNQTTEWLKSRGYEDLLPLVSAGQGGVALSEALKRMQPGYGAVEAPRPIEVNGVLVDPVTFQPLYDGRTTQAPDAPSGYQWSEPGRLAPIPGGPQDPSNAGAKPPTDAQRKASSLYTVVAPDAELLLGPDGNSGIFEKLGDGGSQFWNGVGVAGINPMAGLASGDFQSARDAVTNIAQSYLYAMSGAAAPAEEVKKIADLVTPNPGDSQQRKDEKRRRLQSYVQAVQNSTIPAPMTSNGGGSGGYEVLGVIP